MSFIKYPYRVRLVVCLGVIVRGMRGSSFEVHAKGGINVWRKYLII